MDDATKKKILVPVAITIGLVAAALLAYNILGIAAPQRGVVSGGSGAEAESTPAEGEEADVGGVTNRAVAPE